MFKYIIWQNLLKLYSKFKHKYLICFGGKNKFHVLMNAYNVHQCIY